MKIDIAEVSNIRNLLDQLVLDQRNLAVVVAVTEDLGGALCVTTQAGVHLGDISKDELLSVLKARIDASLKVLSSRYSIEFRDSDKPLPPVSFRLH